MLCPPQRTPISRSRSRATRTAAATSSVERQRAIRAGRRSIMAFQIDRAASYPGAPGESSWLSSAVVCMTLRLPCIGTSDKNRFAYAIEDQFVSCLAARDRPDRDTGSALHLQIEASIRERIRSGLLPAGIALPPTRALADELGVSRGVVVEAYAQLVAEGYLTSRSGSYTHVAPRATRDPGGDHAAGTRGATARRAGGRLRLRPRRPAGFPRAAWLRSVRRVLTEAPDERLGYLDGRGAIELRTALAAYLNRVRGTQADPERMVITNGYAQAVSLLLGVLARRGAAASPWRIPHRSTTPALSHARWACG